MAEVGDIWYRIVDQAYSIADPWTREHSHSSYEARVDRYEVVGITKCGVWLSKIVWPGRVDLEGPRRFQNLSWTKQIASPTIEAAKKSYAARKDREIWLYQKRAEAADSHKTYGLCLSDRAFTGL